jgi:hypothetical protein
VHNCLPTWVQSTWECTVAASQAHERRDVIQRSLRQPKMYPLLCHLPKPLRLPNKSLFPVSSPGEDIPEAQPVLDPWPSNPSESIYSSLRAYRAQGRSLNVTKERNTSSPCHF